MFDPTISILVVDDFGTMRKIIKNILKELGYTRIDEADDGSTAWPMIIDPKTHYDLIVTDWNMPNITGLELLKKIRAHQNHAAVPVLMVTAETKKEQIVAAAQAGVSGYIIKPFNAQTLRNKLALIANRMGS